MNDEMEEVKRQADEVLDDIVDLATKYIKKGYRPMLVENALFAFAARLIVETKGPHVLLERCEKVVMKHFERKKANEENRSN